MFTPTIVCWPESMRACVFRGGFLDAQLGRAVLDGLGHAAKRVDFLNMGQCARGQVVGQALDKPAAAPRINGVSQVGLAAQHDLGVAGDPRRKVRRQGQRFIQRIGV